MIKLVSFSLAVFIGMAAVSLARAEGGQVGKEDVSPVFSGDGQPIGLTLPVPEGCIVAANQSQVAIFCLPDSDD